MRRLDRLLGAAEIFVIVTCTIAGLGMAVLQVILRYVFNTGIHWLEAAVVTALIWAMLMAASRAARLGLHPRVELLAQLLPAKPRAVLNFAALFASLLLSLFYLRDAVIYGRFVGAMSMAHPELGIGMVWPYLIIPAMLGFYVLRYGMILLALLSEPSAIEPERLLFAQRDTEGPA